MELNIAQIFNGRAQLIGNADAVAGGCFGVCGVSVDSSDAAACQNAVTAKNAVGFAVDQQIGTKTAVDPGEGTTISAPVVSLW